MGLPYIVCKYANFEISHLFVRVLYTGSYQTDHTIDLRSVSRSGRTDPRRWTL